MVEVKQNKEYTLSLSYSKANIRNWSLFPKQIRLWLCVMRSK